jgi:hypothetical protein
VALRYIVQKAENREVGYLADLDVNASAEELNDQLQIALEAANQSFSPQTLENCATMTGQRPDRDIRRISTSTIDMDRGRRVLPSCA